jgi:hypothetical protein
MALVGHSLALRQLVEKSIQNGKLIHFLRDHKTQFTGLNE